MYMLTVTSYLLKYEVIGLVLFIIILHLINDTETRSDRGQDVSHVHNIVGKECFDISVKVQSKYKTMLNDAEFKTLVSQFQYGLAS